MLQDFECLLVIVLGVVYLCLQVAVEWGGVQFVGLGNFLVGPVECPVAAIYGVVVLQLGKVIVRLILQRGFLYGGLHGFLGIVPLLGISLQDGTRVITVVEQRESLNEVVDGCNVLQGIARLSRHDEHDAGLTLVGWHGCRNAYLLEVGIVD